MADFCPLTYLDEPAEFTVAIAPARRRTVVVIGDSNREPVPPGFAPVRSRREECAAAGLAAAAVADDAVWSQERGGVSIWAFDEPDQAHRFAEGYCAAFRAASVSQAVLERPRLRIGIATSPVVEFTLPTGMVVDGPAFRKAIRLQEASLPGQICMDPESWASLPTEWQSLYSDEETVYVDTDFYRSHRRTVITGHSG